MLRIVRRPMTEEMKKTLIQRRIHIGSLASLVLGIFLYINDIMVHTKASWDWIVPSVFFLFSWGMYRKSRLAAWGALFSFLSFQFLQMSQAHHTKGVFWLLLFSYCFFIGIRGTTAFHRWAKQQRKMPPTLPANRRT